MKIFILIIQIVCLIIVIYETIDIYKTNKEMDKLFEQLNEDYIKKMKALTLHLTPDEALELIHEVVSIPDKFYLGVNSEDILKITLFQCDYNMPNKMGKSIETFTLESYRPNELICFGIELKKYIDEKAYKNEL